MYNYSRNCIKCAYIRGLHPKLCIIIHFALFFVSCSHSSVVELPIRGYAKTSVNTVIFRNAITSNSEYQFIAYYDSVGSVILAKRELDSEDFEIKETALKGNVNDAHNSISIIVDGEDYLHLCYNQHFTELNYYRNIKPGSLDLIKIPMTGKENNVTYPQFFIYENDLLFICREGHGLVINRYDTKTQTWSRLQDNILQNAYWQTCVVNDTIYLSWCWRETADVSSNHDICFAKSADGKSWYKTNNEQYQLPITQETAEYAMRITQNSGLMNQTSMSIDSKGNPYIATYIHSDYYLIYLDNQTWQIEQITDRRAKFELSGIGTKRVPISRPLILIDKEDKIYLVFRDENKLFLAKKNDKWKTESIYDSVGYYEPCYDKESWSRNNELNLFIQRVGQGDNEALDTLRAQKVIIKVI